MSNPLFKHSIKELIKKRQESPTYNGEIYIPEYNELRRICGKIENLHKNWRVKTPLYEDIFREPLVVDPNRLIQQLKISSFDAVRISSIISTELSTATIIALGRADIRLRYLQNVDWAQIIHRVFEGSFAHHSPAALSRARDLLASLPYRQDLFELVAELGLALTKPAAKMPSLGTNEPNISNIYKSSSVSGIQFIHPSAQPMSIESMKSLSQKIMNSEQTEIQRLMNSQREEIERDAALWSMDVDETDEATDI